ncbi:uncharacterized protein V1518DRAFT_417744 [Limtongia smithiae]|uniref:uncharacterized protein n=1 Tax=Limtongia smithiae TaxID=1125753 RepID=UPI0034CF244D
MKISSFVSTAAALVVAASAVVALPEGHSHHRHKARNAKAERRSAVDLHKRAIDVVYTYVTVVVDAEGNTISPAAAESSTSSYSTSTTYAEPTTTSSTYVAPTTSSTSVYVAPTTSSTSTYVAPTTSSTSTYVAPTTSSTSSSSSSSSTSSSSLTTLSTVTTSSSSSSSSSSSTASAASSTSTGLLANYEGPYGTFTDGVIPCSTFPSGNGVIPVSWLGYGGWTGIQISEAENSGDGTSCEEGNLCSYACQPGMSKTQWPSTQPADGESRGGLKCTDGYLVRTNTDTDYLCEWGVDSAYVVSNLTESVAICRTDYPGTENMVVPTVVDASGSQPLTVVDEATYYQWEGNPTSAQYYVNNAGVSEEDGCIWGTEGSNVGNYAPLNFGAGYSDGVSYLSLIPNPNTDTTLNFNVKIVAAEGGVINGDCYYIDGVFSGDSTSGCTVAVTSGQAHFVLY